MEDEDQGPHGAQDETEDELFILFEDRELQPFDAQGGEADQEEHHADGGDQEHGGDGQDRGPAGAGGGDDQQHDGRGAGGEGQRKGKGEDRGLAGDRLVLLMVVARVEHVGSQVDDDQEDENGGTDLGEQVLVVLHELTTRDREGGAQGDVDADVDQAGNGRDGKRLPPGPALGPADEDEAEPVARNQRVEKRERERVEKRETLHGR